MKLIYKYLKTLRNLDSFVYLYTAFIQSENAYDHPALLTIRGGDKSTRCNDRTETLTILLREKERERCEALLRNYECIL